MWNKLPTEILHRVFLEIADPKDISNCQLTCKSWSRPAQYKLYNVVSFNGRDRDAVTRFINGSKREGTRPGELVKTLRLGDLFDEWNYRRYDDYLSHLANICPNVEELDAEHPVSSFWEDLAYVIITHWPNLKITPIPSQGTNVVEYALSLLQIRRSLTTIIILPRFYETLEGLKFITNLKYFTNLRYLLLTEATTGPNIDDLIQDCFKLEKLHANLLHNDDDVGNMEVSYDEFSKENRPHIKELTLEAHMGSNALNYIMGKFGCLEKLSLRLYKDFNLENHGLEWREIRRKFINYLLGLSSYNIYSECCLDLLYGLIALPYNISHMKIALTEELSHPLGPSCSIKSGEKNRVYVAIYYQPCSLRTQIVDMLEKVGKQVYKMNFETTGHLGQEGKDNIDYIIEDVIEHCTTLSYLDYSVSTFRKPLKKKKLRNESITGMVIRASKVESLQALSTWLPRLNRLKIYTTATFEEKEKDLFFIDMPHSSLKYLYLELEAGMDLDNTLPSNALEQHYRHPSEIVIPQYKIYVKLYTETFGERYFLITKNRDRKSEIQETQKIEVGSTTYSIKINCRDLETFCIKMESTCVTLHFK